MKLGNGGKTPLALIGYLKGKKKKHKKPPNQDKGSGIGCGRERCSTKFHEGKTKLKDEGEAPSTLLVKKKPSRGIIKKGQKKAVPE